MNPKTVLFDLDGVITDTAKIHSESWKEMFDNFLREYYAKKNKNFIPFSEEDYVKFVDGKPRYKGAQDFLKSRNINLPYGSPKDSSDKTVCGLGNIKNNLYTRKIKKSKPFVYKPSVSFIKKLKKSGYKIGLISSSKNSRLILDSVKLTYLFDEIVDGKTIEKMKLSGKPNPDMFIYASKKLNSSPGECIVFEDAVSGVEAGIRGNFGMVVGVSRNKSSNLEKADKVIKSFKEISLRDIEKWFEKGIEEREWILEYFEYNPEKEKLRETLTATGNGYFCTRGCYETQSDSAYHYPGFYMAGIYDKQTTTIHGKKSSNNDLVNLPNWLLIKLKIGNEEIDPFKSEIISYKKTLNMKEAFSENILQFKDIKGRVTEIKIKRFASMDNPHVGSLKFELRPLNYSEKIKIISVIDGDVINNNVERYRELKQNHLHTESVKKIKSGFVMNTKTLNSDYKISIAIRNNLNVKKHSKKPFRRNGLFGEEFLFEAKKDKTYVLEKTACIFSSRDSKTPEKDSENLSSKLPSFEKIFKKHKSSWYELWKKAGIYLEGDRFSQRIMRLHVYHLLTSYSPNVINLDVGLTARGLHGEAYRGRTFWDEIYVLPFYIHRFPKIARASLIYRYNRLKQAKENATENGYKGAMYPWQSSDTGEEETPKIHYNPRDKTWGPDYSRNQRHVSIAIFYNFFKYLNHTNDKNFLEEYAAEVMVEIARFWASIAKFNPKEKKYHIEGVMGPDEFHEKYPYSRKPGVNDNAYTNIMASWLFQKSIELCKNLPEKIIEKLKIKNEELTNWDLISKKLYVPIKNGIILQFDKYDKLKELNWKHYRKKYGDISRLDRILKAEGKSPDSYKVLKQADTLMVFYLLEFDEAVKILKNLGIKIHNTKNFIEKNYDYYISRTTHGSNLSRFVHGIIALKLNHKKENVWDLFHESLKLDIYDTQGGTTQEGIHTGLMAGTINIVRKYFAGIKTHENGLRVSPWMPQFWKKLSFRLTHHDSWYNFLFNYENEKNILKTTLETGSKKSLVEYKNKKIILSRKKTKKINLD